MGISSGRFFCDMYGANVATGSLEHSFPLYRRVGWVHVCVVGVLDAHTCTYMYARPLTRSAVHIAPIPQVHICCHCHCHDHTPGPRIYTQIKTAHSLASRSVIPPSWTWFLEGICMQHGVCATPTVQPGNPNYGSSGVPGDIP